MKHSGSKQQNTRTLSRLHGRMRNRIAVAQGCKTVDTIKIHENINKNSLTNNNNDIFESSNGSKDGTAPHNTSVVVKADTTQDQMINNIPPPPAPQLFTLKKTQLENFRIMFHVMTQDHQLPDLIWNEQTRLE